MNHHIDFFKEQHRFHQGRLKIVWLAISVVFLILVAKSFWMMVIEHDFWLGHRQQRLQQIAPETGLRRTIVDRNNQVLALSIPSFSIGWHPDKAASDKITAVQRKILQNIVSEPWDTWRDRHQSDTKFVYLARNTPLSYDEIGALKQLESLELSKTSKRLYPMGSCGAQILGYLSYEQQGAEGAEKAFNSELESQPTIKTSDIIYRDAKHRWFFYHPAQDKNHKLPAPLQLTLDNRVTALVEQALSEAYSKGRIGGLSAVVVSVPDGALLASVSYPSFDPNNPGSYDASWRFKPLLDLYEMGSVIKPFSMAAILNTAPEASTFETRTDPGEIIVQKHAITDVTKRRFFTFPDILIYSSNIALVKALQKYPPKPSLLQGLKDCGLTQRTGLPFDNEPSPIFPQKVKPKSLDEATLSFGYTSQISLLQLARAYLLFARPHETCLPPLSIVFQEDAAPNLSCFTPKIGLKARAEMAQILQRVVKEGSARRAFSKNISVAGKTGTAKRLGTNGYEERYHAFFVGFFPAEEPKYLIAIHADDPQGKIYGGEVCAPIAKELIEKISVLPDITYKIG
jgi:cell division protein FtsI (penicillin-binding protein 3)